MFFTWGDKNFFPKAKGRPEFSYGDQKTEKIGDRPSQTEAPLLGKNLLLTPGEQCGMCIKGCLFIYWKHLEFPLFLSNTNLQVILNNICKENAITV